MTTYIVARHPGAVDWMRQRLEGEPPVLLDHLDGQRFRPGDVVCGVLPLRWAAAVCSDGARVMSLEFAVPQYRRGQELTLAELEAFHPRLVAYVVQRLDAPAGR